MWVGFNGDGMNHTVWITSYRMMCNNRACTGGRKSVTFDLLCGFFPRLKIWPRPSRTYPLWSSVSKIQRIKDTLTDTKGSYDKVYILFWIFFRDYIIHCWHKKYECICIIDDTGSYIITDVVNLNLCDRRISNCFSLSSVGILILKLMYGIGAADSASRNINCVVHKCWYFETYICSTRYANL